MRGAAQRINGCSADRGWCFRTHLLTNWATPLTENLLQPIKLQKTPVERLTKVSAALGVDVWIKRDDQTHPLYGGNKPRKLAGILNTAKALGYTTVVTAGTVGSHHVLATGLLGRSLGIKVHAVVAPQPATEHAMQVAYHAQAIEVTHHVVGNKVWLPFAARRLQWSLKKQGERSLLIPIGGSSVEGCAGYFDAVLELLAQINAGALGGQLPSVILCPHGSGGTHAGLLAAVRALKLPCKVVGVQVAAPWSLPRLRASIMAERVIAFRKSQAFSAQNAVGLRDVYMTNELFGGGYGVPSAKGAEATRLFAEEGIELDPTYTAKTAAAIQSVAKRFTVSSVLYWHTLSSAALPTVEQSQGLRPELKRLLV